MKWKIGLIIMVLGACIAATSLLLAQTKDIDLLWKARALQAAERIKEFTDKPPNPMTIKDKYEMMVEAAFGLILIEPEIVIKKSSISTNYHLLFNIGDRGFLDVFYTYDAKTQELISMGVDQLPKNWRITIPSKATQNAVIAVIKDYVIAADMADQNQPMIAFSTTDPFSISIIAK